MISIEKTTQRNPSRRWSAALSLGLALALAAWAAAEPGMRRPRKRRRAQEISRVIAKEMTAAQKALQAGQWQEALKNLDAAEQKSPLTAFDKKTIYNFKGFANVKLGNLKAAQAEFEKALATGAATAEEVGQHDPDAVRHRREHESISKDHRLWQADGRCRHRDAE